MDSIRSLPDNSDLLVVGDFNAPDINWNTLSTTSTLLSPLCDLFLKKSLVQLVTHETHKSGHILDLVLSNSPDRLSHVLIDSKTGLNVSDHYLLFFNAELHNHI